MPRNYSALPRHLRFSNNKMADLEDEMRAGLRPVFQGWEQEWADDGTLPGLGVLYVPTGPTGPVGQPAPFADALLTVWDVWQQGIMDGYKVVPEV